MLWLLVCLLSAVPARATTVDDYTAAIHRALTLVQFAQGGDLPSVQQAIQVLETAPGPSQPEVLRDLGASPPDLVDAQARLAALYAALQQQVDTPDPQRASRQLHDVLSMPRYAGIASGPSLLDRLIGAVIDGVGRFLSWLGIRGLHLNVPLWIWLTLAGLGIAFVILWPLRGGLSTGGRSARLRAAVASPRPSMDFFAEADRLAASDDFLGAIRALAGGVAVRLSGERAWDQSPYTVRELFSRSQHPEALRSLLRSFEEASYGDRPPDAAAYARAAAAAEPYRPKVAA